MRKKIIVLWMIICMSVMMFVGCGGNNTSENGKDEQNQVTNNEDREYLTSDDVVEISTETLYTEIVGDVQWKIEDGILIISGTGMMESCYKNVESHLANPCEWGPERNSIKEVVIEEGITTIGRSAFQGTKITRIEIPDGVTYIDQLAFGNCIWLSEMIIPESVTFISEDAFHINYGLKEQFAEEGMPIDNLIIYGVTGSYAEEFAREQGYVFVPIK